MLRLLQWCLLWVVGYMHGFAQAEDVHRARRQVDPMASSNGVHGFLNAADDSRSPRQLDPIAGGEVLRRNLYSGLGRGREVDFPASKVINALLMSRILDTIRGGHLLRALDNTMNGGIENAGLMNEELFSHLDDFNGGDAFRELARLTDGEILRALEGVDGTEMLLALDKARQETKKDQKRTLDTLSGMAFGEMKRAFPLSRLAKKNFDEIDNVGFNGWQKKSSGSEAEKKRGSRRYQTLSLARRNFGGPRRLGVSSLAKKNFDEIDRTGFEGFSKREAKTSL